MSRSWRSVLLLVLATSLIAPQAVAAGGGLPPSCVDGSVTINEDQTATGTVSCDPVDSISADYEKVSDVSNGTLTLNSSDGSFSYTPPSDFNGSDSFDFNVTDVDGTSNTSTFTININAVNDEPSFTAGSDQSVPENAPTKTVNNWATGISKGPPDENGQTVNFIVTNDDNGLFSTQPTVSPSGTLTYRPATSANGSALVSVKIHDNGGLANGGDDTSPIQTFTIAVSGVNDPPSFTIGVDQTDLEDAGPRSIANWATNISPGPSDESLQTVTFVIDTNTNPSLFAAGPAVSSSGRLTYTPADDANGSADITLHAHDSGGGTDNSPPQTFTINVTPVNDEPSFTPGGNQSVAENAGAQTVAWATSISKGPSDESSQIVNFIVTNNNSGLFSAAPAINPAGTLTYTPAASANGTATVSVKIHDNGGGIAPNDDTGPTETFTITVTGVNDPPSFVKGANPTVLEDAGAQSIPGWATSISPGPPDESSQIVTFVVESNIPDLFAAGPAVSSGGTLTFTPSSNLNGTSTVILHAHDNGGGSTADSPPQTFTITITAVNDPPSFSKGGNQTVAEDTGPQTVAGWATAISPGPSNESTQTIDFAIDSDTNATLFSIGPAVSPTGTLTYTLAPNANGVATIGLHIHDNGGAIAPNNDTGPTVTFKITVTPVNDPPTCTSDSTATFVDSALNATLTTCTDIDADPLTYNLVGPSIHGTTLVHADGTYTYTPNAAFQGTDTFTFSVNDGTVASNTATMSILVAPDPIARNDVAPTDFPAIVQGSGPTAIPVLANDLDKQMGPLLIQSVTQGAKGKVTITGGGTGLTYDPTGLVTGTDSFRYTIIDNQARTNSAIVVVSVAKDTVKPVATVPSMLAISPSTLGSTTVKVRITWSASDVGSGVKMYLLQESAHGGPFRTVALAGPLSRSVVRNVIVGKGYRYRVRATDAVGNVGFLVTSPVLTPARVQETSAAITYAGAWGVASSSTYSGAKSRWSKSAGASATYMFNGRGIAWVSAKSLARGGARVYIDGVLIRSVSLRATRTTARQVVFATRFGVVALHTIRIVVIGTAGHPRVDLDAFVVTR